MKILLICGGKSHEHEISLKSAQFIINNTHHDLNVLVIEKNGNCYIKGGNNKTISQCSLGRVQIWKGSEFICKIEEYQCDFNVVFPILHGPFGEDGTIQGWLELLGVPYVGCGVTASAISMDKDIAKRLVTNLGFQTTDHIALTKNEWKQGTILDDIDCPVFVKAANSGSSIGVYKVRTKGELPATIEKAFNYDDKILIEKSVENAREIEVAILEGDNHELVISMPGEVLVKHDFYSYEAKYIDSNGAKLLIPAPLTKEQANLIQKTSKQIFKSLRCSGMARIDFLLQGEKLFFNEINTIPGFTEISLYPNLMKALGIGYSELIDTLINNAIRHPKRH